MPPTISADDIGSYVNAMLGRLERFVDRELQTIRRTNEEIPEDGLTTFQGCQRSDCPRLAIMISRGGTSRSNPGSPNP